MIRPRGVITYGPPAGHDHGDWRDLALCAGTDPDLWFVQGTGDAWEHASNAVQLAKVKRLCSGCPVAPECLADAYEQGDKDSVRGGMTPTERENARRNAKRKTRAKA